MTGNRYAAVSARCDSQATIERYLPGNYRALGLVEYEGDERLMSGAYVVISGVDDSGWTLDDYVIPRLASGLIVAQEIDSEHPMMSLARTGPDGLVSTEEVTRQLAGALCRAVQVQRLDAAGEREPWSFKGDPLADLPHEDAIAWLEAANEAAYRVYRRALKASG